MQSPFHTILELILGNRPGLIYILMRPEQPSSTIQISHVPITYYSPNLIIYIFLWVSLLSNLDLVSKKERSWGRILSSQGEEEPGKNLSLMGQVPAIYQSKDKHSTIYILCTHTHTHKHAKGIAVIETSD